MRASNETGVGKRGTRAEMFDKSPYRRA